MRGADDEDWVGGWAGEAPAPAPLPPAPPAGHASSKLLEVICCPTCGSVKVYPRDNAKSASVVRWECGYCGASWKEPAGLAVVRCYARDSG